MEPEHNSLEKLMDIISIEGRYRDDWEWDANTTLLLAIKDSLAGMLKATLNVTNNFQDTTLVNGVGLVQALSETLNGIMNNMQLIQKDGTNRGSWHS